MKHKIALLAIIGIILLGLLFGYFKFNKPHQGVENSKAAFQISASQLFKNFSTDETSANKKYLGKVISVKGQVLSIQHSAEQNIIQLSGDENAGGISCLFSNAYKNGELDIKKNDEIVVKGKCSGFLMDVNLVDCIKE